MIRVVLHRGLDVPSQLSVIINPDLCFFVDTDWYNEQEFFIYHREELLNEFIDNYMTPSNFLLNSEGLEHLRNVFQGFLNMKLEQFRIEEPEKYYDYKLEEIAKSIKKQKDPFEEIIL